MHDIALARSRSGLIPVFLFISLLSGCLSENTSSGTTPPDPDDQTILTGSVGDGPVVGASLTVTTVGGDTIATQTSDNSASYSVTVDVPDENFPLLVSATGGTDLVTNLPPDFMLRGAALSGGDHAIANINPFTTLAVELALQAGGDLDAASLDAAESLVTPALDTGLTSLLASGTLATEIDESNVAEIVRAGEALAEIIRRTSSHRSRGNDQIITELASDLVDGVIDGNGGASVDARTAAVATLVAALVRLETMSNALNVNGVDATAAMVAATEQVAPAAPSPTVRDLGATEGMLRESRIGLAAAWAVSEDPRIAEIRAAVDLVPTGMNGSFAASLLPEDYRAALIDVILLVAAGDMSQVELVNSVVRNGGVVVTPGNNAPTISGTPTPTIPAGDTYSFRPTASDADGDTLTFAVENPPAWAEFDALTGRLFGTPGTGDVGSYLDIVIVVTDGDLEASMGPFTINVVAGNLPPSISGSGAATLDIGDPYEFTPTASDPDGDTLAFSIVNQPSWATFDATAGRLSGTPGSGDSGTFGNIVIRVSDGELTTSLPGFTVTVLAANTAPTISGTPDSEVTAGSPYAFTPTANDVNGDTLTFAIENQPSWATFDPVTGRLSGNPGVGDAGSYLDIVIGVSDGELSASLGPFTINVVVDNRAPTLSGSGAATIDVGELYDFTPNATDPDGDALTFSVVNPPSWAGFDAATGRLSGTPGSGDVGTYNNIMIRVSDGDLTASLGPFSISVIAPNTPPTIGGAPNPQATTGILYSFLPTVNDADNDVLTFSISGKPVWAGFDANTGLLSGTPGSGHVGPYDNIRITVSDGQSSATLGPFVITVVTGNRAPMIGGAPAGSVTANAPYSFTPNASDADGDDLTFSISGKPDWAQFNANNGMLSGTPDDGDVGTYTGIRITVSDGEASATLGPFSITVVAGNTAPTIGGMPAASVNAGSNYVFMPNASDADGDTLTFSIMGQPGWAQFNTSTGALTGTPDDADIGVYTGIRITVSDGQASATLGPFSITVNAVSNGSVTLSWNAPTENTDGSTLTDLAGYKVYWRTSPGAYTNSVTIDNPSITTYVLENLAPGTYEFVVTAVNADDIESDYSNQASRTVQ